MTVSRRRGSTWFSTGGHNVPAQDYRAEIEFPDENATVTGVARHLAGIDEISLAL